MSKSRASQQSKGFLSYYLVKNMMNRKMRKSQVHQKNEKKMLKFPYTSKN